MRWQSGRACCGLLAHSHRDSYHQPSTWMDTRNRCTPIRLFPRGLVGRTGKVLGCRALLLVHDAKGHPLFATTHRGDLHLTKGAPTELSRYEQTTGSSILTRLIIDREGMAAESPFSLRCPGAHRRHHPALESIPRALLLHRSGGLCAAVSRPRRGGDARGGERSLCSSLTGSSRADAAPCSGPHS